MEIISDVIVPLVFIGMGLFVLGLNNEWFGKPSSEYTVYPGKIIEISSYESGIKPQGKHLVTYGVKLMYEYHINGETHQNDIIYKNADTVASSDKTRADRFIREYPLGKLVSVKVHRDNVDDTYLIEKSPITGFINVVSVVILSIGIFVLLYNW